MAKVLSRAAAILLLALPGTAAAAPPPNDSYTAPAPFESYSARGGFPIERQATAELAEATPDAGVAPCLGPASMARTVWFTIPATPDGRELTIETVGRTTDPIDIAAFVQGSPPQPPVRPNACAGVGVFGDDATEDRTTALRLRIPPFHSVLVQVGRRGAVGSPDDERALVTLEDIALGPLEAPLGDRAGPTTTPRIGRSGESDVFLGGATTTPEDPAVPSCPALAGVWRRVKPRRVGRHTFTAIGSEVGELSVFSGGRPDASRLLGCVDREGPGALVLPVRVRSRSMLWVRLGTDRPKPESEALLTFRRSVRGDAESGGGFLASARPQVRGGPARGTRSARALNRTRSFELSLRVLRGPVCGARIELRGPGGVTYARGEVAALRGRGQLVLLPRVRRLRRGLYRLRIEATRLGGVRGRVPSTVLFRLR
jgi:hypothetical protein